MSECENCANRIGCGVLFHPFHDYTDEHGHSDGCFGWEPDKRLQNVTSSNGETERK